MLLLDWYREWLEIRAEFKAKKFELSREVKHEEVICKSCETYREQLEIANYEKKQLLDRIMEKPITEPERTTAPELTAVRPKTIPWHVRQQMLEREDREKARALRSAASPDSQIKDKTDINELEKELGVAQQERESKQTIG